MRRTTIILGACLAFSIGINAWLAMKVIGHTERPWFTAEEAPFVDRAIQQWAALVREDASSFHRMGYARAVTSTGRVCVALAPLDSSARWLGTYCFDTETGKFIEERFTSGIF